MSKQLERAPEPKTVHRSRFAHVWQASLHEYRMLVHAASSRPRLQAIESALQQYPSGTKFAGSCEVQFIVKPEVYNRLIVPILRGAR
jgi:hypothetical protein